MLAGSPVTSSLPYPHDDSDRGAAAWLRFVDEGSEGGTRAALFTTSGDGEPLAFSFTRIDWPALSLHDAEASSSSSTSAMWLAQALLRLAAPTPALVVVSGDELTCAGVADGVVSGIPMLRAGTTDDRSADPSWLTEEPAPGTEAQNIADNLLAREAPLEPFDRIDAALAEAFEDERVQAMASIGGVMSVVSLLTRPDYLGQPDDAESTIQNQSQTVPPLAVRLWRILASPPAGLPDTRLAWPGEFMPFQKEGIAALLGNNQLLLADDMGLGKTVQAIAAMRILHSQGEVHSSLVVAPASLLKQWRRELDKWAPELSAIIVDGSANDRSWKWPAKTNVKLVSYDTLRSDFEANAPVGRERWGVVVADEAQRIKNRNDTSAALKGLQRTRSWALTGTPIENHEEELASILEFVDYDQSAQPKRYYPGPELWARHRELQLRRRKADVLDDLPPKMVTLIPIELHPKQRREYEKAEQEGRVYLKSLGTEVSVVHVLELIARLKQICNADPESGDSSKLDDILDRIESLTARGHKALVFSQYVSGFGVEGVIGRLRPFSPLSVTGSMSLEERQAAVDRFKRQDEHKVLVLSLRAGGLGLNLQEASYVFHLDRWWNPAIERQAEDRSHRLGQQEKVNVIKYSCIDTIEERIDQILERKQSLFDDLIDDVSLDLSAQLNREELLSLFGL